MTNRPDDPQPDDSAENDSTENDSPETSSEQPSGDPPTGENDEEASKPDSSEANPTGDTSKEDRSTESDSADPNAADANADDSQEKSAEEPPLEEKLRQSDAPASSRHGPSPGDEASDDPFDPPGQHQSYFGPAHEGATRKGSKRTESGHEQSGREQAHSESGESGDEHPRQNMPHGRNADRARTGGLPPEVWAELRAPFSPSDVRLNDIRIDPKTRRGLARPIIDEDALIRRLTAVLGPEGWSLEFTVEGPRTYRCRLYIGTAFRDGVATGTEPIETCLEAMRMAMRTFEIGIGLHGPPNIYVEKDEAGRVANFEEIVEDLREIGTVE